jgi:hypothetical protein
MMPPFMVLSCWEIIVGCSSRDDPGLGPSRRGVSGGWPRRPDDLFSQDRDVPGGLDGESDLPAGDRGHGDSHVTADDDHFVNLPAQDQHRILLMVT